MSAPTSDTPHPHSKIHEARDHLRKRLDKIPHLFERHEAQAQTAAATSASHTPLRQQLAAFADTHSKWKKHHNDNPVVEVEKQRRQRLVDQIYQIHESLDAMNDLLSLMDVYVSIEFEELGIKAGGEVGVPKELQAVVRAVEDARNDLCMIGAVANEGLKLEGPAGDGVHLNEYERATLRKAEEVVQLITQVQPEFNHLINVYEFMVHGSGGNKKYAGPPPPPPVTQAPTQVEMLAPIPIATGPATAQYTNPVPEEDAVPSEDDVPSPIRKNSSQSPETVAVTNEIAQETGYDADGEKEADEPIEGNATGNAENVDALVAPDEDANIDTDEESGPDAVASEEVDSDVDADDEASKKEKTDGEDEVEDGEAGDEVVKKEIEEDSDADTAYYSDEGGSGKTTPRKVEIEDVDG